MFTGSWIAYCWSGLSLGTRIAEPKPYASCLESRFAVSEQSSKFHGMYESLFSLWNLDANIYCRSCFCNVTAKDSLLMLSIIFFCLKFAVTRVFGAKEILEVVYPKSMCCQCAQDCSHKSHNWSRIRVNSHLTMTIRATTTSLFSITRIKLKKLFCHLWKVEIWLIKERFYVVPFHRGKICKPIRWLIGFLQTTSSLESMSCRISEHLEWNVTYKGKRNWLVQWLQVQQYPYSLRKIPSTNSSETKRICSTDNGINPMITDLMIVDLIC